MVAVLGGRRGRGPRRALRPADAAWGCLYGGSVMCLESALNVESYKSENGGGGTISFASQKPLCPQGEEEMETSNKRRGKRSGLRGSAFARMKTNRTWGSALDKKKINRP